MLACIFLSVELFKAMHPIDFMIIIEEGNRAQAPGDWINPIYNVYGVGDRKSVV